jgi:hypothetical protein
MIGSMCERNLDCRGKPGFVMPETYTIRQGKFKEKKLKKENQDQIPPLNKYVYVFVFMALGFELWACAC